MPVSMSGVDFGKKWEVFVSPSAFGGFTAYIQFGKIIKALTEPLPTYEEARQAGYEMLVDLFDEVEAQDAS